MNIAARQSPLGVSTSQPGAGRSSQSLESGPREARPAPNRVSECKARVYVAAENRLLREALARMLTKRGSIKVIGLDSAEPFRGQALVDWEADVLLLVSRGNLEEDLKAIRETHSEAPGLRILLIGTTKENGEFLQCVRAGISGYLEERIHGRCAGRHPGGAGGGGGLSRGTVHRTVPLFRTRGVRAAVRGRKTTTGIYTAGAATDSLDCQGAHQQRDRESLLPFRTDSEESPLPDEA